MPFVRNMHDKVVEVPEFMLRDCLLRGMKLELSHGEEGDKIIELFVKVEEPVVRKGSTDGFVTGVILQ